VICSSLGCWLADVIMFPIDTIATRIKVDTTKFISFKEQYRMIVANEGYRGMYRGISTSFNCAFVPSISYFAIYELLNQKSKDFINLRGYNQERLMNFVPFFTAGISEMVSLLFYLPFDTIRTRLQINHPDYQYTSIL